MICDELKIVECKLNVYMYNGNPLKSKMFTFIAIGVFEL
jgi:hypothetical protein